MKYNTFTYFMILTWWFCVGRHYFVCYILVTSDNNVLQRSVSDARMPNALSTLSSYDHMLLFSCYEYHISLCSAQSCLRRGANERNKLTQREANLFSSDRCAWRQLMTSPWVRETAADVECGRVVSRSSTSVDSSQYTEQSFVGFPQSHARSRSLIRSKYGKPPSAWPEGLEGQSTVVQIWPKDWLYQCAD